MQGFHWNKDQCTLHPVVIYYKDGITWMILQGLHWNKDQCTLHPVVIYYKDEVQGFHWNKDQCTLYPVVIYYKDGITWMILQGFHWNKDQCTLHQVVIYYKDGLVLKHVSLCFLSDDLEHDTSFVYELQRQTATFIKEHLSKIRKMSILVMVVLTSTKTSRTC